MGGGSMEPRTVALIPPMRPLEVSSTVRHEPSYSMVGRGQDEVIEFTLPGWPGNPPSGATFVRARVLSSRPVPADAQDPQSFMTHKLEYIVGGIGQEWVKLDEAKKTLQTKGLAPLPYKRLEGRDAFEPAPGQYGITSLDSRFPKAPTPVLGSMTRTLRRKPDTPCSPEPATYTPPVIPTTRPPQWSFGSAPRLPKAPRAAGPEPGHYKPLNCWDGRQITLVGRTAPPRSHSEPAPGLEPTAYDAHRGLRATMSKDPVWRLNSTGGRSKLVTSDLPAKVGPGTYDVKFGAVRVHSPVATWHKRKGFSLKPHETPPDPPFAHFSLFCK